MTQPILVKTERRNRQQLNLKQQSGLGLVEILVAVLVLGIGILGVASTQVVSLQTMSQSQSRSQAVLLAEDILERVRANSGNPADYALVAGAAVGADDGACDTSFVPTNATVAGNDVEAWENNLVCLLPAAQRTIEVVGKTVTITIDWNQKDQTMNPIVVRTEV